MIKDRPVGPWKYYYPSGTALASGEYSHGGELEGAWRLWSPSGQLDVSRPRLRCVDGRFGTFPPGRAEFESILPLRDVPKGFMDILPFYDYEWIGVGLYAHGKWVRELTQSEALRAAAD